VIERGYEGYVAKDETSLRARAEEAVVEGEAEGLEGRGGRLAEADQRGAAGAVIAGLVPL
jgi:hypothetical protein